MTLPRELVYKNNKIYQKPVEELKKLRKNKIEYHEIKVKEELSLDGIEGDSYELIIEMSAIEGRSGIRVRTSETEKTDIYIDVENKKLIFDRNQSGEGYRGIRKCDLERVDRLKLHIFMDRSSIEIFVNDGEEVFTSRIFPSKKSQGVVFYSLEACKLDKIRYYKI
jgi:beta-fructofuranosidase